MPSINQLKSKTNDFFQFHWTKNEPIPDWSNPWDFEGEIPNQDQQGCYALLNENKVVYIGVGASRGSGSYEGAGLGNRLHKYWRKKDKNPLDGGNEKYILNSDKLGFDYDEIITIGLGKFGYLSYALEVYLIRNLDPQPKYNKIGKKA